MSLSFSRRRLAGFVVLSAFAGSGWAGATLLNVSYDVSREFYKNFNAAFAAHWKKNTGEDLTLNQCHGGSSRQARSVADGLEADVITMNQHNDIDILAERGKLIPADWAKRLPNNSAPTTSISVILVRKGKPKNIRDWSDLGRTGVSVIIPNAKTSGHGRYTYLAAWGAGVQAGLSPDAAKVLAKYAKSFPKGSTFAVDEVFGGWTQVQKTHFADGGVFDQIYTRK